MNRPLRRKLENLILAYLDANKTGKAFADITFTTGSGTTLADEIQMDAGTTPQGTAEPDVPFCAVFVTTQPDQDMPGVHTCTITLHLKTNGTAPAAERLTTDAILRDLHDVLIAPPDDNAAFTDANPDFGALRTFANKPGGSDTRPTYRKPLHIYGLWLQDTASLNDDEFWHDQITLAGHAQDMDDS